MNSYTVQQNKRNLLGRWDSIAIILGIVIGVGIFRVPAEVAKYLTSPHLVMLVWLAGGIISLLGALCYCDLASLLPENGGNYIYLRESYGLPVGFIFGWTELLVIRTGSIASLAYVFAEYCQPLLCSGDHLVKPLATAVVVVLSLVNLFGLRHGKLVQDVATAGKVLALLLIIVLAFLSRKGDLGHFASVTVADGRGLLPLFGLALIPVLWTYGGWHENTFVTGETKNARTSVPFALIAGAVAITVIYLAMNLIYIYLMPITEQVGVKLIGADVMHIIWGKGGKAFLQVLVIVSCIGGINAMIITGSRVTHALAVDNPLFDRLSTVHEKYASPHRAIIINALWAVVLILWGNFNKLLFFTGAAVWLFFALATAGLFVLRRKYPERKRPFRASGYPVVPLLFILVCTVLFINTVIFSPRESAVGLFLILSGIPLFLISQKLKRP